MRSSAWVVLLALLLTVVIIHDTCATSMTNGYCHTRDEMDEFFGFNTW
jgi:hypothetical protein